MLWEGFWCQAELVQCFEVPLIQAALSTWMLPGGICLYNLLCMYDLQFCLHLPLCILGKASVMLAKSDAQVYHLLYINLARLHIYCCAYTKPAQVAGLLVRSKRWPVHHSSPCSIAFHVHFSTLVTTFNFACKMLQITHLNSLQLLLPHAWHSKSAA